MTILQRFVAFAEGLSPARLEDLEDMLAGLMAGFEDSNEFSPAELAELDRRAADPDPRFADPAAIADLLRRR